MAATEASPLDHALARVGDRWSLLVVQALLDGPRRFSDLLDRIEGIAPNILSHRLKHLEHEAIVRARPYSTRPVRFTYELTAPGRELAGALRMLAQWGARGSEAETPRHDACGTPLQTRWFCPTCARIVEDDEGADVRYV